MAIIFAKNSGLNDDLWKVNDQIVRAVLQDTDNEKNNDDELVNAIYNVEKSDKFGEKITSLTEFGNFAIVDEGDAGVQDELQQGFSKLIVHKQFMKGFTCTAEMNEDNDINGMKVAAANYLRAFKRTRAQFASDALTTEGANFIFSGKTIDKTTGDGQGLFSTGHTYAKAGVSGTQSNVFTNAFGTTSAMLNKLANIGRNFKNASGNVMGYTFDTIIIPGNCPTLEDTVKKIIRTDLMVGSDYNDINTQKGLWKLVIDHRWIVADNKAPYILMSSEANKELQAAMFYDRIPLTVHDWVDDKTANLEWMGRARMSAGFNNWQAFILGGADAGTEIPS
jgi:hypothetical protein